MAYRIGQNHIITSLYSISMALADGNDVIMARRVGRSCFRVCCESNYRPKVIESIYVQFAESNYRLMHINALGHISGWEWHIE